MGSDLLDRAPDLRNAYGGSGSGGGELTAQNDELDEAVHPRAKFFPGLPTSPGLPEKSNFVRF